VKEEEKVRFGLALCAFEEEDEWHIKSGCSHHMSGNKEKIIYLKKNKSANIILQMAHM